MPFEEPVRMLPRGAVLRRENDPARDLFVLQSGWAYSHNLLGDGTRQILRIELPGDMLGVSGLAFAHSPEAIIALTDIRFSQIDRSALRRLYIDHPRLAAMLHSLGQAAFVAMADRLVSLGRTSAKARLAALLVDLAVRLRAIGAAAGDMIPLPLTQEELGDATGLTAVHVNRMLRVLGEERLIERGNGQVRILDETRLLRLSGYADRFAEIDTSWLPPANEG